MCKPLSQAKPHHRQRHKTSRHVKATKKNDIIKLWIKIGIWEENQWLPGNGNNTKVIQSITFV